MKAQKITSVKFARAHCGSRFAMRTAGSKCNNAQLYGKVAALWFFLIDKNGGMFEAGRLPDLTAFGHSRIGPELERGKWWRAVEAGGTVSCQLKMRCLCACLFGFSVSCRRIAHRPFPFTVKQCAVQYIFFIFDQCLGTRVNMVGRPLGTTRSGRHPLNITQK